MTMVHTIEPFCGMLAYSLNLLYELFLCIVVEIFIEARETLLLHELQRVLDVFTCHEPKVDRRMNVGVGRIRGEARPLKVHPPR